MTDVWKRRALLASFVVIATAYSLVHAIDFARAEVSERSVRLGEALFGVVPLLDRMDERAGGESRELRVNGATLRMQVRSFEKHPRERSRELLTSFEADCRSPFTETKQEGLFEPPVFMQQMEGEGVAFCMKPREALSLDLFASFARASDTPFDLTRLGVYQSLFVRSGKDTITALSVEILDGFVPERMFPVDGDVPGRDFADLPRPPGKRVLSISLHDAPVLNTYQTRSTLSETLADLRARLGASSVALRIIEKDDANALFVRTTASDFIIAGREVDADAIVSLARLPR